MTQSRSQNQLRQDYHQRCDAKRARRYACAFGDVRFGNHPASRSKHRETHRREKEQLRQSRVRSRNCERQIQLHRQSAEQSLNNHQADRSPTDSLYPGTLGAKLEINCQHNRQQSDASRHQTMPMFPKKVTDHLWKELAVRQRPIRRCESRVVTGDVRARNDEKERGDCDQQRETMNTPGHRNFELRICNCGLKNLCLINPQFAIRNSQSVTYAASETRWPAASVESLADLAKPRWRQS